MCAQRRWVDRRQCSTAATLTCCAADALCLNENELDDHAHRHCACYPPRAQDDLRCSFRLNCDTSKAPRTGGAHAPAPPQQRPEALTAPSWTPSGINAAPDAPYGQQAGDQSWREAGSNGAGIVPVGAVQKEGSWGGGGGSHIPLSAGLDDPTTAAKISPSDENQSSLSVMCLCGEPAASRTSQTARNPGRVFYRCARPSAAAPCEFFQWADAVSVPPPAAAGIGSVGGGNTWPPPLSGGITAGAAGGGQQWDGSGPTAAATGAVGGEAPAGTARFAWEDGTANPGGSQGRGAGGAGGNCFK